MTGRSSGRRPAFAALAMAAVLAGCGSSSSAAAPPPVTATPTPVPASVASPTPSPDASSSFQAAVDPVESVGSLLLTADREQQVCGQAFAALSDAEATASDGSTTATSTVGLADNGSGSVIVMTGGRALLRCSAGIAVVDLFGGRILWHRELRSDESLGETAFSGTDHVLLLTTTHNAASGLQAAYESLTLTALSAADGSEAWTQPFEEFVDKADRSGSTDLTVDERPPAGSTTPPLVIHGQAWSAFDPVTGKPLWHIEGGPSSDSCHAGVCLAPGDGDAADETVATDLHTGRVLWHKRLPDVSGSLEDVDVHGEVAYLVGSSGFLAFDLTTGRVRLNRLFPKTWSGSTPLVTPDLTLAFDGAQVALYRTSNLNTPLWTAQGDGGTPIAVTPGLVAVSAPSGTVVLDAKTGHVRNDVVVPDAGGDAWTVDDGLAVLGDGSVLELTPPSSS
jgi:outer membrane protein assembly factor BamB